MWFKRQKYVPKLPDFLALCERNYAQLNRYLTAEVREGQRMDIQVTDQHCYRLTITELARFTTTLQIELLQQGSFFTPRFSVRLYHDAQVAEVLACQHLSRFAARYDYPNSQMLLPDEKRQINLLLRDWLKLCSACGYQRDSLAFA